LTVNKYLDIWNDVLRLVTLQPRRSYRDTPHAEDRAEEVPTMFRYERRGGERFYG